MKSVNLSPLHQVEYAVPDLALSQRFFREVFGEAEVEKSFFEVLSNPALAISHAGFGQTVQQFCQPLMPGLPHYDALQAHGPCVHNLCYLVDSIDNIVANCRDAGLEPLIEFPMGGIWETVIAADNLQGNHQSYIIDTQAVFGFQLELAETPWITEPEPPLMLPAYGPQWQQTGAASGNVLSGINVVVPDLGRTLQALQVVFAGSLSVIEPPTTAPDGSARYMLVELGLVRLAYLQPLKEESELAHFLRKRGPAVHALVARTGDLTRVKNSLDAFGIEASQPEPAMLLAIDGCPDNGGEALQVRSLAAVGVEFTLIGDRA